MGYVIDTNLFIKKEKGLLAIDSLLNKTSNQSIGISVITASELLHGVHPAKEQKTHLKRSAFVEAILSEITLFPFGIKEARIYAQLWADLAHAGITLGAHDVMIAATAMALGHSVLTLDKKDFTRIPGLQVESI